MSGYGHDSAPTVVGQATTRQQFEDRVMRDGAEAACQWAHGEGVKPGRIARLLVNLAPNDPAGLFDQRFPTVGSAQV